MENQQSNSQPQGEQQIPGYQILSKLGAGAMAVVFKAKQISLDRTVAIKVMPKKMSQDAEYVQRFYVEGQVAAKLNHPNIVAAIDVNEAHGYHYFVMEYVEGKTVYDDLQKGKIYSEEEALDIAIQMSQALIHAHKLGLMHRDVKPKNIMITNTGVAKLMDMGLARITDDPEAIAAEAGRLFGTPYYISPEQIIGKNDVDKRCDIYSLGATLYHMVTGKVPFEGEDAKTVMIKHCKEKLVAPDRHNIDLSFGLVKVIQKMMAKKRSDRYQTAEELLEDLQSLDFMLETASPKDGADHGHYNHQASLSGNADNMAPSAPEVKTVIKEVKVHIPAPINQGLLWGLIISGILNIVLLAYHFLK